MEHTKKYAEPTLHSNGVNTVHIYHTPYTMHHYEWSIQKNTQMISPVIAEYGVWWKISSVIGAYKKIRNIISSVIVYDMCLLDLPGSIFFFLILEVYLQIYILEVYLEMCKFSKK